MSKDINGSNDPYYDIQKLFDSKTIIEYIANDYGVKQDLASSITSTLLEGGYNSQTILNGKCDKEIRYLISRHDSIEFNNIFNDFLGEDKEEEKEETFENNEESRSDNLETTRRSSAKRRSNKHYQAFEPKKRPKNKAKVAVLLTLSVLSASVIGLAAYKSEKGQEIIKNIQIEKSIDENLGMLASSPGSYDYENRLNIVEQNTRMFNANAASDTASDMLQIISDNPEFFDLCLANVYFNLNSDKLSDMDSIFSYLKTYLGENPDLSMQYDRVKGCDVFLDYLMNLGLVDVNDEEKIVELQTAINIYKVYLERNNMTELNADFDTPFRELDRGNKKPISELLSAYKEYYNNLKKAYVSTVEQTVNPDNLTEDDAPNFGGR